ncbi:dihydroxyacetone kinase subunit DhaK [Paracoccus aurantiacus]|uniref:Dihydroxyacetone kinase subunit DhaK n=1 Tax=Paracoccus aurantiacus TaxID=2599412 RepID=A0A5C6RUI9_9RHOB|nr:dihydroxyacetone kinase subunit DhaL [Paracoccus aurantiacus]TXB65655.1 dihydroxyacetone kinase subunit DhaK [Paracoccus aurantiacus]
MARTKKLINHPDDVISDLVAGLIAAHSGELQVSGDTGRAIVATNGPRAGKVGVVIGGGSGHEPAFVGYVGRGLADAVAIGNVFASPAPNQIADAARAANGGAGVIFLYGNYTGDVMNFTMAAEMLEAEGVPIRQVQVTDDVLSAPIDKRSERRGIAGDVFVFKVAGAAADQGHSLDRVEALTRKANAAIFSAAVALGPCSLPQTGKPNFQLGDDEMEIGMGLHGEPGVRREKLANADIVVDDLMASILADADLTAGDRVAVMVNGLGATSHLELYILFKRVSEILSDQGVELVRAWVGEYATSLEMAGASITVMALDDELAELLFHPCHSPAFHEGAPVAVTGSAAGPVVAARTQPRPTTDAPSETVLKSGGPISATIFRDMMRHAGLAIIEKADWLSDLDGQIGDGDHGVSMAQGWRAVLHALDDAPTDETISQTCGRMGSAFLDAVGASSGPLYATAFQYAGHAVADRLDLDAPALAALIAAAADGITTRGGAVIGDKTMADAWIPAADVARQNADTDVVRLMQAVAKAAEAGMNATADLEARKGRAAKLGKRSLGHVDPGAASAFLLLSGMRTYLARDHLGLK